MVYPCGYLPLSHFSDQLFVKKNDLKMAKRSEAENTEKNLEIKFLIFDFDAKLRFALLVSLS